MKVNLFKTTPTAPRRQRVIRQIAILPLCLIAGVSCSADPDEVTSDEKHPLKPHEAFHTAQNFIRNVSRRNGGGETVEFKLDRHEQSGKHDWTLSGTAMTFPAQKQFTWKCKLSGWSEFDNLGALSRPCECKCIAVEIDGNSMTVPPEIAQRKPYSKGTPVKYK